MTEVRVLDDDEWIEINLSLTDASLLVQLLGKLNPQSAGGLGNLYEELIDAGVEPYSNVVILDQSEPNLHIVIVDVEESTEDDAESLP